MLIDKVNLNHLRIFASVYQTKSMTLAAKELHLTQSGISQHMKTLEDCLEVKLFDRVRQKLLPTSSADLLFSQCHKSLYEMEDILWQVTGKKEELSGMVRLGMPLEFGNNLLLPLVSKFAREHPSVQFHFEIGLASELNHQLLDGKLDFAFVDEFKHDPRIRTERVYDERLELCAHPKFLKKFGKVQHQRAYYESLEYVAYLEDEPTLKMWFAHHLGGKPPKLNVKAYVSEAQSVARLIRSEVACGILPGHLLDQLNRQTPKLTVFTSSKKPLKNKLSMAYLPDRTLSPCAQETLKWVVEGLRKL